MFRSDTGIEYTKNGEWVVMRQTALIPLKVMVMDVEHIHCERGESYMGTKLGCHLCALNKSREEILCL